MQPANQTLSDAATPSPALRQRRCPACNRDAPSHLRAYSPPEWDVARCEGCGFVYLRNPPPYEALEEEFAWERTFPEKRRKGGSTPLSGVNRKLRAAVGLKGGRRTDDWLAGWIGGGRVLDIGCGARVRVRPPVVPYGIELSRQLHARADEQMRRSGGFCVHAPGAEGIWRFEPDYFDGVVMNSYLEHEVQPLTLLRGVHRTLKSGGVAFVRVPNFGSLNRRIVGRRWCGFRHPDHVNYFTVSSLARLARSVGFEIRLVNRVTLPVNDNIQALLTKA